MAALGRAKSADLRPAWRPTAVLDLGAMNTAQLTFLRFLGASAVVIFHFGWNADSLTWANRLWTRANGTVAFFFVMSGFILARVYGAKGLRRATDFYIARVARILPLYWIGLLVVVLYLAREPGVPRWWIGLSALLLQSWWVGYSQVLNFPGWSLSVEVFLYLLFPFLLRGMLRWRTRTLLGLAATAWALNMAVHGILFPWSDPQQYPHLHDFMYYSPLTHLATFVVGIAGGVVFDRAHLRLRRWSIPLTVGGTAAFFASLWLPSWTVHYELNGLLAPVFVLVLWGLGSNPDLMVSRVLRWSPLVMLGEASYGIYILQLPVRFVYVRLVDRETVPPNEVFWLYYAALVVVAVLALKWVDAPLRRSIKRAYARFLRPMDAPLAGARESPVEGVREAEG